MEIIQNLYLEVYKDNKQRTVYANQFEYNSRYLRIQLMNNGVPLPASLPSVACLEAIRPGGGVNDFIGTIEQDGKVLVPLDYWITEIFGTVRCKLSIVSPKGTKLSSATFLIKVERSDTENRGCYPRITQNSAITQILAAENARIENENLRVEKDQERDKVIEDVVKRLEEIEQADEETIKNAVDVYFEENPISAEQIFTPGENLILSEDGTLSVKTTDELDPNSDLPISSKAVAQTVGSIEDFLNVI